jgi:hypothetical protein
VLKNLPKLERLDKDAVTDEERDEAAALVNRSIEKTK